MKLSDIIIQIWLLYCLGGAIVGSIVGCFIYDICKTAVRAIIKLVRRKNELY